MSCLVASFAAGASPNGVIKKLPYLPASLQPIAPEVGEFSYPEINQAGNEIGKVQWRVVAGTGNCCESYLHATPDGRILNFGGSYPVYSDDLGQTWTRVATFPPLTNGEGAITQGPNGDVLGVSWDPYSGDRLVAFKFDAITKEWDYLESPVHAPFYDRPWISVIPGPFVRNGSTYPYLVVVRGGWPYKQPWLVSYDGLTYTEMMSPFLDSLHSSGPGQVAVRPFPLADWSQPHLEVGVIPTGPASAIAYAQDFALSACPVHSLGEDMLWRCTPVEDMESHVLTDSKGRLHGLKIAKGSFTYSVGNRSVTVPTPAGWNIEQADFKANGELGLSAVALHLESGPARPEKDVVYKIDTSKGTPSVIRILQLGEDHVQSGNGLQVDIDCALQLEEDYGIQNLLGVEEKECTGARFDFASIVVLPSGKVAVSFIDRFHLDPAVAIEM